jgi:hypothetical protein
MPGCLSRKRSTMSLREMEGSKLDELDQAILARRLAQRETVTAPRVGDFVRFSDRLERISHDWGDKVQTSEGGSFYLAEGGQVSFSGGLNPSVPKERLRKREEILNGRFWFFHRDLWMAHNGVDVTAPCRVYEL